MQLRGFFSVFLLVILSFLVWAAAPAPGWASSAETSLSKGQTVYVPAYSNVFSGPKRLPFQLATTLSIRNTDLSASFRVTSVDYYDSNGKLLRRYLEKPLTQQTSSKMQLQSINQKPHHRGHRGTQRKS